MKIYSVCLIPLMLLSLISSVNADVGSELARLEKEIEDIRSKVGLEKKNASNLKLYGSFRPVITAESDGSDSAVDVRDALSRFGLSGQTPVLESSTAFFSGEWNVKMADEGQIDGARLALVGIRGDFGELAVGKQRPPHYSLIAEHVDIFNHASSPYAYDNIGPFFIDNMTTYQYSNQTLDFKLAMRTDGNSGSDTDDLLNIGLSFNADDFYIATAYLKSTSPSIGAGGADEEGDEFENIALATYINLTQVYLAAAYQGVTKTPEIGDELNMSTLDVSAAYSLPSRYKLKAGFFIFDDDVDGTSSAKHQGINLTLERQLADNVRVHIEYLTKDYDERDTLSALSFGMRYDFSSNL